jgi:hypothetical protein
VDPVGTGESGVFVMSSYLIRGVKAGFLAELASSQTDIVPRINPEPVESTGDSLDLNDYSNWFAEDPLSAGMMFFHGALIFDGSVGLRDTMPSA